MRATLAEIARVVGGRTSAGDVVVSSVTSDSREARAGAMFVALPGDRVDGHDFVAGALAAGASAAMVAREGDWGGPVVLVPDSLAALMKAARELASPIPHRIGITGSSGKTITKDLTAAVLGAAFRVYASPRSFNTEIGVPLTMLNAPDGSQALVLEMGSRGIGHIRALCEVAGPTAGVVTNVGSAHLGVFGSRENIATAKVELVESLGPEGIAILNADDPVVAGFADRTEARVVTFGTGEDANVRALDVRLDSDARASFTLRSGDAPVPVELALAGEHMVSNALAAAAVGHAHGVAPADIADALKSAPISGWRMEVRDRTDGVRVVNDAYNANPASVSAALRAARWMARERRCWAVLGEMAELGEASADEHDHVGEQVARLGIEELVTVGERGRDIARGAVREGVEPTHVRETDSAEEALAVLRAEVRPGDVILVKGSRVTGLERVAIGLTEDEGAGA